MMKTGLAMAAAVAALWMAAGCDDAEPVNEAIRIEPNSVALKKGESATFTASGGYDYTWKLKAGQESWGFLSTYSGPEVTYTSLYDPGAATSAVQVLTVISTIPDMHRAATNAPGNPEKTAEAYITHITSGVSL